jgi:hypothetical protein
MVSTGEVNILWLIPVLFFINPILLNSGRTGASYPEIVYIVTHGCSLDYFPG